MNTDLNAINFTSMCFIVFAIWTMTAVAQNKTDHNLPLTFCIVTILFNRAFDRGLNFDLLCTCVAVAAVIRFEFLSSMAVKWFSYLEMLLLTLVILNLLQVIFGPQMALRF